MVDAHEGVLNELSRLAVSRPAAAELSAGAAPARGTVLAEILDTEASASLPALLPEALRPLPAAADLAAWRDLPTLRLRIHRADLERIAAEHFATTGPLRGGRLVLSTTTPEGRGLYSMAHALHAMRAGGVDILACHCLEIALGKTLILSLGAVCDLRQLGTTWGPSWLRVQKALDFMKANLEHIVPMEAVARAAGCSQRALGYAFEEVLGLGPAIAYRNARLDAAYHALLAGDASVTEVATRFGFEHMGRFSRAFQERFHQKPSRVTRDDFDDFAI